MLSRAATELGLEVQSVGHTPAGLRLRPPRVVLLRASVPSADEGWTRFVFESQAEVRYTSLRDTELHQDLRSRFDVVVVPDGESDDIFAGHRPGRVPPQFVGGVGREGVAALRSFVEGGGVLVAVGGAARFAVERLDLEVDDLALGADRGRHPVFGPGCILAARLDPSSPLAHGLPREVAVFYQQDPVFLPRAGRPVLRYASPNPLLSGGLLGGAELASRAGLVEVPLGRGKVILFGFRPVYRGQARATLPLLLNALYLSSATPVPATH